MNIDIILDEDRLSTIVTLMGPEATREDAEAVAAALPPGDLPADAFEWLRTGDGAAPSASVLLGIYNDLTDSRKGDLVECAKVIAMAA